VPDRLRTVLIGFGRIAAGYAHDTRMGRWFPFATHVQVLRTHPAFALMAVVDTDQHARNNAQQNWGIANAVSTLDELENPSMFEVAVIATHPERRFNILERLPNLKAIIVEKPLATDLLTARDFLNKCASRNILVQVNFPRRGDTEMRRLADTILENIGEVQAAFALYGNGLNNNGSHIVDWARMFLGEVNWVRALPDGPNIAEEHIFRDTSIPFILGFMRGGCLMVQPLTFANFRENSLDIWGEKGRLSFWQEGLIASTFSRTEHRFLDANFEIACDRPRIALTGQGKAIYELYSNLTRALLDGEALWSSGKQALKVMEIVTAIRQSFVEGGKRVNV
jgi:predicted dehydrogenase